MAAHKGKSPRSESAELSEPADSVESAKSAKAASKRSESILVPLAAIRVGKRERSFRPEHVQELKINIQDVGLINPITVSRETDGTYMLVAGRHRLEAFRELYAEGDLRYQEVNVLVIAASQAKKVEWSENLYRNDLTVLEKAEHLVAYLQESGDTVALAIENLSRNSGQSRRTFFRYKAIGLGIQVADEIKTLDTELVDSTRQLYFLATQCSKTEQKAVMRVLRKSPGLSAQQAYAQIKGETAQASEKSVPVLMPLAVRDELGLIAKKRKLKKGEFLEQFMQAALDAYKQGAFEVKS